MNILADFFRETSINFERVQNDFDWQIKNVNRPCRQNYRLTTPRNSGKSTTGYILACTTESSFFSHPFDSLPTMSSGSKSEDTGWFVSVNTRLPEYVKAQRDLEDAPMEPVMKSVLKSFIVLNTPSSILTHHPGYQLNISEADRLSTYLAWIATFTGFEKQNAALREKLASFSNTENLQKAIDEYFKLR